LHSAPFKFRSFSTKRKKLKYQELVKTIDNADVKEVFANLETLNPLELTKKVERPSDGVMVPDRIETERTRLTHLVSGLKTLQGDKNRKAIQELEKIVKNGEFSNIEEMSKKVSYYIGRIRTYGKNFDNLIAGYTAFMSEISETGDSFLQLRIPSKYWIEYRKEQEARAELIRNWNRRIQEPAFLEQNDRQKKKERLVHEAELLNLSSLCGLVLRMNSTHLSGDYIGDVDNLIIGSPIERKTKLEHAFKSRVKELAAKEIIAKYKDQLISVKGAEAKSIIRTATLPDLSTFGSKEKAGMIITYSVEKGIEVTPLKKKS